MENSKFCQSCTMPLDNPALLGTEKDGSKSNEYCTYCYRNGAFINPEITMTEMETIIKEQMQKRQIDPALIKLSLNSLPHLKRWANQRTFQ